MRSLVREASRRPSRAREAFLEWSEQPAANRGAALAHMAHETEERAEELAQLVVREVGKPIGEARAELSRGVAILRYYAQLVLAPDGEAYPATQPTDWLVARRHPAGVCGLLGIVLLSVCFRGETRWIYSQS